MLTTLRRLALALMLSATLGFAQTHSSGAAKEAAEGRLLPGMGSVHHPVSTKNPEAQRFFDQGLALVYGFNHDEAARSFRRAAELDPNLAMAWWGVALAVGPNYNLPVDQERELEAYRAIQKARALSAKDRGAERAYIEALAKRYTDQPTANYLKLEMAYHFAMRELSRAYPDDLDAATLFAESGMNLRPWRLWNRDGTPAPGTEEIVATLESVLKRDPNHLGANHYYIHAVEASKNPERALPSAQRLPSLAPAAGHLVHMPGHIFIRTGDHAASERTNVAAAQADEKYLSATNAQGIYPMMYYTHNLHFIAIENAMMGRYEESLRAAQRVQEHVQPHAVEMPMLDGFMPLPTLVLIRFNRWDEILKLAQPDPRLAMSTGIWHYARGLAFANRGQLASARTELAELRKVYPNMAKVPTNPTGPRNAGIIPQIAAHVIEARIAQAEGDSASTVRHLREAVALEDSLDYNEPPDWFYPVRESLGAALLASGNAAEAERTFRDDLTWNPRNGRSLFGLTEALKAQGRMEGATAIEQQYKAAWQWADAPLQVSDLWNAAPASAVAASASK